jgi:hypothetical protein
VAQYSARRKQQGTEHNESACLHVIPQESGEGQNIRVCEWWTKYKHFRYLPTSVSG